MVDADGRFAIFIPLVLVAAAEAAAWTAGVLATVAALNALIDFCVDQFGNNNSDEDNAEDAADAADAATDAATGGDSPGSGPKPKGPMEAADRRSPCDPESRRMNTWEYKASPEGPGWRDLSNWLLVDRGLQWTAFDLWVSARDESCDATPYIAQLEGPTGLTVGTRSFEALALKVLQLIDGVIVGWDAQPPQRESNDVRAIAAAAVEAIDGAWWRVYARDERRLNELFARFPGALKLDPLTPMPAVHRES